MMENIVLAAALALIIGGAAMYVYRAKKKGRRCIGCPDSAGCGKGCGCCCNKGREQREQDVKEE